MNNTLRQRELAQYIMNYADHENREVDTAVILEAIEAFESVFECNVVIAGDNFTTENNS